VQDVAEQDPPQDTGTPGTGPQGAGPQGTGTPGGETWPTYTPPTSTPAPDTPEPEAGELPPAQVPYGDQPSFGYLPGPPRVTVIRTGFVRTRGTGGCGLIATLIMLVVFLPTIFGLIAGVRAISGGFDELEDGLGSPFSRAEAPDLQTAAGFEALLDAVRAETGSTTVFEASLYEGYAVVYVPVDATSKRYFSYYYDGDLSRTSQGTTTYRRYDLATIEGSVIPGLVRRAGTLVDDPETVYVIIRSPAENDQGAWFSVHASNEFMESGYFTADQAGKVVFQYVSE
jgi:hypothetical protein